MTIRALINRLSANPYVDWDTQIEVVIYTDGATYTRELQPEDLEVFNGRARVSLNTVNVVEEPNT